MVLWGSITSVHFECTYISLVSKNIIFIDSLGSCWAMLAFRHSSFVQKFLEKGQGNPVRNVGTKKTRVLVLRES